MEHRVSVFQFQMRARAVSVIYDPCLLVLPEILRLEYEDPLMPCTIAFWGPSKDLDFGLLSRI